MSWTGKSGREGGCEPEEERKLKPGSGGCVNLMLLGRGEQAEATLRFGDMPGCLSVAVEGEREFRRSQVSEPEMKVEL